MTLRRWSIEGWLNQIVYSEIRLSQILKSIRTNAYGETKVKINLTGLLIDPQMSNLNSLTYYSIPLSEVKSLAKVKKARHKYYDKAV